MIEKKEVLKLAESLNLRPDTVEKDYVLGWMLFGINTSPQLKEKWAFKGGTSLKKCFFETFRFSEDLDFTISDPSHFNSGLLVNEFHKIADTVYEETGIEFKKDKFTFKIIDKDKGKKTAQGKIYFNGPLRRKVKYTSIKLDLTNDEILVLDAVKKKIHHPYSDEPSAGIIVNCYAFEEVIAEKIRALAQRARPRDLYDVVHFFRNRKMISKPQLVYDVLEKKCRFKEIQIPTFLSIKEHEKIEELEPQWKHMLDHQLPYLPPLNSFLKDLEPFFQWLKGNIKEEHLDSVSKKNDEIIFNPGRITGVHSVNAILHKIQFAAGNRVCLKMRYRDKLRTIEPLSFRKAQTTGNRLFYGFHKEDNQSKAFIINKIQSVEVTNIPYIEREHPVEITASGEVSMPPVRSGSRQIYKNFVKPRIRRSYRNSFSYLGPKHIYECYHCNKKFRRKQMNSKLNPHKDKSGYFCPGRVGNYLGYE